MKTVTLTCAYDGHTWERASQRGRRPHFCPKHQPVVTERKPTQAVERNEDGTETLTCAHGHTWTRPPKRGRKPTLCPEHAEEAEQRRAERAEKAASKSTHTVTEEDLTIYSFLTNNELGAVIYCDQILAEGTAEEADLRTMALARKEWMRYGKRRLTPDEDVRAAHRSLLPTRIAAQRRIRRWDPNHEMYKEA